MKLLIMSVTRSTKFNLMQRSRSNSDTNDQRYKRHSWSISEEKRPLLDNLQSSSSRVQDTQLNIDINDACNETDKTLHKLLNRGEKLDDMNEKANELRNTGALFRKRTQKVENQLWWEQNYFKLAIYLLGALLALGNHY